MLLKKEITDGSVIQIPAGTHYLTEPIVVSGDYITIKGEDGAIIRGTVRLSKGDFWEEEPGVWCADTAYKADAFYIGERKYKMARYPKANQPQEVF